MLPPPGKLIPPGMLPLSGTITPPGTSLSSSGVWTLLGTVTLGTPGIGIFVPGIMLPPV